MGATICALCHYPGLLRRFIVATRWRKHVYYRQQKPRVIINLNCKVYLERDAVCYARDIKLLIW
jgi:hypothetical protein